MKIAVMSDLHLEFSKYKESFPEADVLLLAGDITAQYAQGKSEYKRFITRAGESFNKIIEIDGNHTGYGGSILDFNYAQNVDVINDEVVIISCTLWSGMDSQYAYQYMNDAHKISGFTWDWMHNQHKWDVQFIGEMLELYKDKKTVVMTHHAPSARCVNQKYKDSGVLNFGFYTDLDWLLNKYKPTVWIHGHMHDSNDFIHESGTRILCNPRGYPRHNGYENEKFDSQLVIEV